MSLIFAGSSDILSAPHTSRFLVPALKWLIPNISDTALHDVQVFIRKCGHLSEYALLGLLLWRARRQPVVHDTRPWFWPDARWAICAAALYAATDEFHQYFVATRQASVWDVCIDTLGATLGIMLLWRLGRWRKQW